VENSNSIVLSQDALWANMGINDLLNWLRQNYAFIPRKAGPSSSQISWPADGETEPMIPFIGPDDHPYEVGKLTAKILSKEGYPLVVQKAGAAAGACHDIGKYDDDVYPLTKRKGEWEKRFREVYRRAHTKKATAMLEQVEHFEITEPLRNLKRVVGNLHHKRHRDITKLQLPTEVVDIIAAVKVADYYHGRAVDLSREHRKRITPELASIKLLEGAKKRQFQGKAVRAIVMLKLGRRDLVAEFYPSFNRGFLPSSKMN
jgi:hypothetical protein